MADAAGNKTEFGYDETTGRKVWEKNASGKFTRYAYDVKGRMTRTWGDSVYPVAYSYDETGRMISMTTYRSGSGSNGETFPENAAGDATKWHYDAATGLLLAKEYADGTKTEYSYAEAGRLDSRIWARKNGANAVSTSYVYDPATASLNKIDYSDETADITFAYDRIGRQKTVTDAVGTRNFAYNDSLQLWKESIDGLTPATITRLYETDGVKGRPAGFIVSSSASKSKNLPQDGQGEVNSGEGNSANLPLHLGEGWGEGKKGKSGSLDYQISYGYDPSGRIKTLSWNAGGKADSATYEYLENSHLLSSMKTGSGYSTSYTYEDHRNVKTSVSNSFGNTAVSTYTYEYDELGRRKSVKNTGSAFASSNFNIYGYNNRSEVTAANSFTGDDLANKNNPLSDRSRAYNYDPIGNRKTATEAANNFAYTANSLNQYESISGGANPEPPAYDLDGNMTVAQSMVYTYNAENRLVEASPQNPQQGSIKSTYIYDYMGRRAKKTLYTYSSGSWQKQKDQSFIYDGWNMVKESEKTSDSSPEVPTYYVWGLDLSQSMQGAGGVGGLIASVRAGNEYLYSFDANGNVGQMVKSSDGSIAARYEYDPFGKTIFSEGPMASENPYRFSTTYMDGETGLYYYGFRFYSAEMGRWINRDPLEEEGGINIYSACYNNDVDRIDILGLAGDRCDSCKQYLDSYNYLSRILSREVHNIQGFVTTVIPNRARVLAHSILLYGEHLSAPPGKYTAQQIRASRMKRSLAGIEYESSGMTFNRMMKEIVETSNQKTKAMLEYTSCYNLNKCGGCREFYCKYGSAAIGIGATACGIFASPFAGFVIGSANNVATGIYCEPLNSAVESQGRSVSSISFSEISDRMKYQQYRWLPGSAGLAVDTYDVYLNVKTLAENVVIGDYDGYYVLPSPSDF